MESSSEAEDMSKRELSDEVNFPPPRWAYYSAQLSEFIEPSSPSRLSQVEVNKKELVTVTGKNSQGNSKGEMAETIPKHEAICRFCSINCQEDPNVFKIKCNCKFTLIHESCATEWSQRKGNNKCNVCEQDIQTMPVTLSKPQCPSSMIQRNCICSRMCTLM